MEGNALKLSKHHGVAVRFVVMLAVASFVRVTIGDEFPHSLWPPRLTLDPQWSEESGAARGTADERVNMLDAAGAGPTVVFLRQEHGWTYGILANHTWSFAGDSDRASVNSTFLQPFLSYQFPTATTIGINCESTYNWHSHEWTIPINLRLTQVMKFGKQPVSFQLGGRY